MNKAKSSRPKKMEFKPPTLTAVATAVGSSTFREILRDRVVYNIFLIAAFLFAISILASKLDFMRPERVLIDFGVSAINIALTLFSIFLSAGALHREIERRTMVVALSRPITRLQFIVGKFCGIAAVLILNGFLLGAMHLLLLLSVGGGSELSGTLIWASPLLVFQSLILSALALMFSTFTTTSLSIGMTLGVYLIGNNVVQLRLLAAKTEHLLEKKILNALSWVFPDFSHFNLGNKVTYGLPVGWDFALVAIVYAAVWIALSIGLAGFFIRRKEL